MASIKRVAQVEGAEVVVIAIVGHPKADALRTEVVFGAWVVVVTEPVEGRVLTPVSCDARVDGADVVIVTCVVDADALTLKARVVQGAWLIVVAFQFVRGEDAALCG